MPDQATLWRHARHRVGPELLGAALAETVRRTEPTPELPGPCHTRLNRTMAVCTSWYFAWEDGLAAGQGVVGDRGCSSHDLRQQIRAMGARLAILTRRGEAAVACPAWIHANRNRVERLGARLKQWRAVASRYAKTKAGYLAMLRLHATADWLKS